MTEENKVGQHIIEVSVKNFMGLIGVHIDANGEPIVVVGPNASGKTSLLEAIRRTLGGQDAKKNKQPIRLGEEFAEVIIKLDNITVTNYFTLGGKPQLKIRSNEGAYFPSPAAMLKDLVAKLAYNPTDFMAMHPLEQKNIVLSMIDTGEDSIPDLDEQRLEAYGLRTDKNKEAKKYENLRNNCGYIPKDTLSEEISIAALSKDLTSALAVEEQHRIDISNRAGNEHAIQSKMKMIESLNEEIAIINKHSDELLISINNYEDPNTVEIQKKINSAEATNEQVRTAKNRDMYTELMDKAQHRSTELTREIKEIDEAKAYILENANMPVKGLGFDENGITLNGVALDRCSSKEKMDVAMNVYFNSAPQGPDAIKIVILQDGSLLDEDSLAYVKQICAEKGYQPIIERVSKEAGANEILIEAGEVKS